MRKTTRLVRELLMLRRLVMKLRIEFLNRKKSLLCSQQLVFSCPSIHTSLEQLLQRQLLPPNITMHFLTTSSDIPSEFVSLALCVPLAYPLSLSSASFSFCVGPACLLTCFPLASCLKITEHFCGVGNSFSRNGMLHFSPCNGMDMLPPPVLATPE